MQYWPSSIAIDEEPHFLLVLQNQRAMFPHPQVFNGCPLRIHCTASWINPETHDQHILVGAEEGIYTLNLNELHENAMDLLYPRRTVWMFVIKVY